MYGSERAHREKAIMSTLIVTVNIIQKFYKKKKNFVKAYYFIHSEL